MMLHPGTQIGRYAFTYHWEMELNNGNNTEKIMSVKQELME